MKKLFPLIAPAMILLLVGFYSIIQKDAYITTIMFVQTVPNESLAIGHDRSLHINDTVTVTGRVVAPPRVNFSGNDLRILLRGTTSRTAYIQDTTNIIWGGIIVRQADTVSNTLFDQLDSGTKVRVTGFVQEFPDIISSGVTQLKLDTLSTVVTLPTIKRRPTAITLNVSDFDSLGDVKFLTGEKYEGMYVQLNNVTVGPQSTLGARHIRSLNDASGNKIYLRDFSNFFSVGPANPGFTVWSPPSVGATVTYIRGVIINGAYTDGNNNLYPYVIVPIYPNDLVLGNSPPFLSSVNRIPGVPKPPDSVQVNATVVDTLDNPVSVDSVHVVYRVNRGAWTLKRMLNTGPIYFTKMPPQSLGTLVEYFVRAKDNLGAIRLSPSDTSKSTYFYYVRNSDTMSIKDVQYTPNNGGFSGYNGYDVTTEGIVTCDTSDISAGSYTSSGGTQSWARRVIIQDNNIAGGWSGIWITGGPTDVLVKGQRVRVRGTVDEVNLVTKMIIATSGDINIISSNNPIPAFANLTPAVVSNLKVDGDTTAEKWESVLIKFPIQVVISCVNAPANTGCTTEYPIPDSSFRRNFGEIFVVQPGENVEARVELQDGTHSYVNGWDSTRANWYNPTLPGTLMYKWDGISFLQGVLYYGFSHYKLVPRRNNDFGTVIGVEPINELATQFWLKQNYPNPFNPVTNIVYNIPIDAEVTLKIYNLLGQEVKTIVNGIQLRGKYTVPFDGTNLASGMYFYVIDVTGENGERFRDNKKMVLVK